MVKALGSKPADALESGSQRRAKIVEQYDRLIAQFGEEPFRVGQRASSVSSDAAGSVLVTPADRRELLQEVTEKSLRCAALIEKALATSESFKRMDAQIAKAHREYEACGEGAESDDDEDMAADDEDDEKAAVLLKELIAASEEMHQANKKLADADNTAKAAGASHEQLSSTEQMLQASLGNASTDASTISDEFRDLYMEEFTSAFGDELDQFRQEDRFESKDVTYLISCIQSGADIFTPLQKKLFVESAQSSSTN